MTTEQVTYLIFGIVLVAALVLDLGILSRKSSAISIKKALYQTLFWVALALGFFVFLLMQYRGVPGGHNTAVEYLSAYLMEWSLSIDNIFVFILIFSFFNVDEKHNARILLIGIMMAIVLRILFIALGIQLIQRFHWLLYIFGGILVYTGINMFRAKHEEEQNIAENKIYKLLLRVLPVTPVNAGGKFTIRINGKRYFTNMFVVIILLATTDVIFALDSIPAVFAISQKPLVIYTSNIFAVLGLRSLFFLLKGAVNKFGYLQQGIALVLVFIGLKMLAEIFVSWHMPVYVSLIVIVVTIASSIFYSIYKTNQATRNDNSTR